MLICHGQECSIASEPPTMRGNWCCIVGTPHSLETANRHRQCSYGGSNYILFALYRTEQIISSSSDTAHTPRVGNHDTPLLKITVLLFSFLTRLLSIQILILCQPLSLSPSICSVVRRCSRFLFLNTWPMNYVFVSSDFAHDLPFMVCCSYIYYSQIVYLPNLCLVWLSYGWLAGLSFRF